MISYVVSPTNAERLRRGYNYIGKGKKSKIKYGRKGRREIEREKEGREDLISIFVLIKSKSLQAKAGREVE